MLDKIFQNQSSIYSSYLCLATERGLNVLQIHLRLHNFKGKRVKINCAPLGQVFGVKKSSTKDEAVQLEASYFKAYLDKSNWIIKFFINASVDFLFRANKTTASHFLLTLKLKGKFECWAYFCMLMDLENEKNIYFERFFISFQLKDLDSKRTPFEVKKASIKAHLIMKDFILVCK